MKRNYDFKKPEPRTVGTEMATRRFEGARQSRLELDWMTSQTSIDYDMRWQLRILIDRARSLEQNNEYIAGFMRLMENNVLGSNPFVLQMKIKEPDGKTHDKTAEATIEAGWKVWSKPQNCSTFGNLSLCDVYRVLLRSAIRDGGILLRHHVGRQYGPHGYQIEPMDMDFLDPEYNEDRPNGNRVRMSVEKNPAGRVVAYWLLGEHPGDYIYKGLGAHRTRVPASEITHAFFQTRANQTRGYPVFAPMMLGQRNLAGYKEAEIVAARTAAGKMGFIQKAPGELNGYSGKSDGQGGKYMDAEAGSIEELPGGMTFAQWDPKHPTTQFGDFVKECLRGMATAVGVSYMNFANDAGDANYSSARISMLEEREGFKVLQRWFVDHVCEPIFDRWLFSALGPIGLPVAKFDKFNHPFFQGRRWQWIDPEKEVKGYLDAIDGGITSPSRVMADNGMDEEEVLDEIELTLATRSELGLLTKERIEAMRMGQTSAEEKEPPLIASIGVGGAQALSLILQQIGSGEITEESGITLLTTLFGFTEEAAKKIAGK